MELHITVSTPELAAAINALAEAVSAASAAPAKPTRTRTKKAPAEDATPVVTPDPAPVQETPSEAPSAPVAPVIEAPAPVTPPVAPSPAAAPETPAINPVTGAPMTAALAEAKRTYTMDELANAGAVLLDRGLMDQLMAVLGKFGVQIITQIPPAQYSALAAELRALGANI